MLIDILIIVMMALFGILGCLMGFLRHLSLLGAVVLAWWAGPRAGIWCVRKFGFGFETANPGSTILISLIGSLVLFVLAIIAASIILHFLRRSKEIRRVDRLLGATLGAVSVVVATWAVSAVLLSLPRDMSDRVPGLTRQLDTSVFTGLVMQHTPWMILTPSGGETDLSGLVETLSQKYEGDLQRALDDPALSGLMQDPMVAEFLKNPDALLKTLESEDLSQVIEDESMRRALGDLLKLLSKEQGKK